MYKLKKINPDYCVDILSNLPPNMVLHLYGDKDINAGETYGVMVTEAFDTRMYLICYIGGSHCSCYTAGQSDKHDEHAGILSMLTDVWNSAGLTGFYIRESQWESAKKASRKC